MSLNSFRSFHQVHAKLPLYLTYVEFNSVLNLHIYPRSYGVELGDADELELAEGDEDGETVGLGDVVGVGVGL